jgi:hypothetical protein
MSIDRMWSVLTIGRFTRISLYKGENKEIDKK